MEKLTDNFLHKRIFNTSSVEDVSFSSTYLDALNSRMPSLESNMNLANIKNTESRSTIRIRGQIQSQEAGIHWPERFSSIFDSWNGKPRTKTGAVDESLK